jgi:hypothetical protein
MTSGSTLSVSRGVVVEKGEGYLSQRVHSRNQSEQSEVRLELLAIGHFPSLFASVLTKIS